MATPHFENFWPILSKEPEVISIAITTKCPLDCVYCYRKQVQGKNTDLTSEQFSLLTEKVKNVRRIILCGIGECLCHPKLYEMVYALRDHPVSLITSGTIRIDYDQLNRGKNVELIMFSIDSPHEEVLNRICGKYNYSVMLDNLANIRLHPRIQRGINCTLNEYNLDHLSELIDFAHDHHIPAVSFEFPIGNESFVLENQALIQSCLSEAQAKARQRHVFFDGPFRLKCSSRDSLVPFIALNGDLFPCCEALYHSYSVGNIYQAAFDSLFQGEEYRKFIAGDFCRNRCQTFRVKGFLAETRTVSA